MKNTLKDIFIACYVAISLHFLRRIVNKKPGENPALDALKNLPEEAKMKIYSDIYANPEYALLSYKGKVTDTGLVIMPYIKPQEIKGATDQMIEKSPENSIAFIPQKDIINDTGDSI
jgi:hypothetical protein